MVWPLTRPAFLSDQIIYPHLYLLSYNHQYLVVSGKNLLTVLQLNNETIEQS